MFPAYSVTERVKNPSPSAAEFTAEQALMWLRERAFYERMKGRTKCQEKNCRNNRKSRRPHPEGYHMRDSRGGICRGYGRGGVFKHL